MFRYSAAELLALPLARSARLVTLARMDDAMLAHERLANASATTAEREFTVAVTRLRGSVRAFRLALRGSTRRRDRNRLRELETALRGRADAASALRWLQAQESSLGPSEQLGWAWLAARWAQRAEDAASRATSAISGFPRLAARLGERLPKYVTDARDPGSPSREVLASWLGTRVAGLRDRLQGMETATDPVEPREMVRAADAVGYLLEPFAPALVGATSALNRLEGLRRVAEFVVYLDRLEVGLSDESAGAEPAAQTGLEAVQQQLQRDRSLARAELAAAWHDGTAGPWLERIAVLAAPTPAGTPHQEIERKFLLRGLPEVLRGAPGAEVEQGWLPGERLVERLRWVRRPDGAERFFRTIKFGEGISRIELEDPTSAELFRALWPWTQGRRVRKRRHQLRDGALLWEVDEFTDRDLVLAEVELPSADTSISMPSALQPYLVREVTGEPEYVNLNLAR